MKHELLSYAVSTFSAIYGFFYATETSFSPSFYFQCNRWFLRCCRNFFLTQFLLSVQSMVFSLLQKLLPHPVSTFSAINGFFVVAETSSSPSFYFQCNRWFLHCCRNFFLTQFADGDNLEDGGILEMDLEKVLPDKQPMIGEYNDT